MNYKDLTYQYNQAQWDAAENDADTMLLLDKLCLQMFGKRFNQLSTAKKQQARTLVAATKSVMYGLTGSDPMRDASMFTSIHQGLMNAGPIQVGGFGSSYYGPAFGAGNVSMAVAGQLADYFGGVGAKNYGMDKQLLGGLVGSIVARNGVSGGVKHINLGTTSGSAFAALDEARKNGVDITKGEGRKLLTAAAAMDRMDYIAAFQARMKDLRKQDPLRDPADMAAEADRLAKEDVREAKKDGKSIFATRSKADRDSVLRNMKTNKSYRTTEIDGEQVELTQSDIEFAVGAFNGKGMGEVITKDIASNIEKSLMQVKDNVATLSGLFGTNDFKQLQQYASDLHLGAIDDAKNVKQVKEWIHQTQAIAYGTGRDVGQVIKDQVAIAEALGTGSNNRMVLAVSKAQAAFQMSEKETAEGGGLKTYSVGDRLAMYTQGVANKNNFAAGLHAMRHLRKQGTLTAEQDAKAEKLIRTWETARTEDEKIEANKRMREYAYELGAGKYVEDPKLVEALAAEYSTEEDNDSFNRSHLEKWGAKYAKGVLKSKGTGQRIRDAGWSEKSLGASMAELMDTVGSNEGRLKKIQEYAGNSASDEDMMGDGLNKADVEYVNRLRAMDPEKRNALFDAVQLSGIQHEAVLNTYMSKSAKEDMRVASHQSMLNSIAEEDSKSNKDSKLPPVDALFAGYLGSEAAGATDTNTFDYMLSMRKGKAFESQEEAEATLGAAYLRTGDRKLADKVRENPGRYMFYNKNSFETGEDGREHFTAEMRKQMAEAAGISEERLAQMEDAELYTEFTSNTGLRLHKKADEEGNVMTYAISDELTQEAGSDFMNEVREKYKDLFAGLSDKTISENVKFDEDKNIVSIRKVDRNGRSTWVTARNSNGDDGALYKTWRGELGGMDPEEKQKAIDESRVTGGFKDGVLDVNSEYAKVYTKKYLKYQEGKTSQLQQAAAGPGMALDDATKAAIGKMEASLASIDSKIQGNPINSSR